MLFLPSPPSRPSAPLPPAVSFVLSGKFLRDRRCFEHDWALFAVVVPPPRHPRPEGSMNRYWLGNKCGTNPFASFPPVSPIVLIPSTGVNTALVSRCWPTKGLGMPCILSEEQRRCQWIVRWSARRNAEVVVDDKWCSSARYDGRTRTKANLYLDTNEPAS